ncbi:MAG: endoglucanase, partial [Lachnospiraceae bacterium]|nr:endoglucanase [Lachnospiraceae bacterium]
MTVKTPLEYEYYNAPIPGGGYVTGFAYDPYEENTLYCRTDIGGCYRYSYEEERWLSLIKHVGMEDLSETFPIALAAYKGRLYIACGDGRSAGWLPDPDVKLAPCGRLCISDDRGESFSYEDIPCYIHGNLCGRGSGKRLAVTASGRIYFASQRDGLGVRDTEGNWSFSAVCGEEFLTFIYVSEDEKTLVVGTAGISRREGDRRGHSLYISKDAGKSFAPLHEPDDPTQDKYSGCVAERFAYDDKYLYVSFSCSSPYVYAGWMGYSCDGGPMRHGRVVRYSLTEPEKGFEDITPGKEKGPAGCGFSGIAATEKYLFCSTIGNDHAGGDMILRSSDRGETWKTVLQDVSVGKLEARAPYLRPECHNGHSPVHWMTDLAINPYDNNELWFNTGTGVFNCKNAEAEELSFSDRCDGIEETVHLNLYSPPSGEVQLIDILGDLGGFAFRDLHKPCDNSFADADNNRYITCINADFPDEDPSRIMVTARGNWTGMTKGGVIISCDSAKSWTRLPLPFGIHDELDRLCKGIENPNVNPGWAALAAGGESFVFTAADGIRLYRDNTVQGILKEDGSADYAAISVIEINPSDEDPSMKVFADRCDPSYFYGFGENSRLYVSSDGGFSFVEKTSPLPEGIDFGLIDCANKTEIRGDAGFFGRFYVAAEKLGLWLLTYDKD